MTREEVLAMKAGKYLDAAIAKNIMGLRVTWNVSLHHPLIQLDGTHFGEVDPYSTDPSATWQVLKKLREEYWCIEIMIADGCRVIMELLRTPPIRVEVNAGTPFEKLPEAICKAALLAKLEAGGVS